MRKFDMQKMQERGEFDKKERQSTNNLTKQHYCSFDRD